MSSATTTQEQLPNKIFSTCVMQYWSLLDITVENGKGATFFINPSFFLLALPLNTIQDKAIF